MDDLEVEWLSAERLRLSWQGEAVLVRQVKFTLLDREGEALSSRIVSDYPYQIAIRISPATATLLVNVERRDGSSRAVRLPMTLVLASTPQP